MASPAANPSQNSAQIEQEKHFGPPVLGKKLFKAKAKGLNSDRFMTLPKGVTYFADNKEREKVDTFVKTILNAPKEFWKSEGAIIYDTLSDEEKEEYDTYLERVKKNGFSIETLGDPSGHKIIISADRIIVLYVDDIQYQAILLTKEANLPSAKLFYELQIENPPRW